ncbi:MAG: hypothetical protein V1649_01005, partial [Patescibacteria group bacterium]
FTQNLKISSQSLLSNKSIFTKERKNTKTKKQESNLISCFFELLDLLLNNFELRNKFFSFVIPASPLSFPFLLSFPPPPCHSREGGNPE